MPFFPAFPLAHLLFRCAKVIAGTQIRTFVKEKLFTHVHGQIICHRKFARVDEALRSL